jgi:hypothetical protein
MAAKPAAAGGTQPMASQLLRWVAGAGALLLIAALLYFAGVNLRCARAVLADPFGLDYGEGIVWQQALLIPGPRMYGPIDRLPFIVFHYPPVYHLASRAVMAFGVDPLAAGRMVSVAATAVIAISIAWLVAADLKGRVGRPAVLMGAVTGALLPLSLRPVERWFDLMRVDMLAVALAFVGVVFAVRAERQPAWLALAMPAFVLSVYTKQTELAAPASALAVLLMVRPRAGIFAGLGGAILGLAALARLEWLTAGGFIRHMLYYNINTWSFHLLITNLRLVALYAVLLAAAVVGLALAWLDRRAPAAPRSPGTAEYTVIVPMVSVWLLLSIIVLLATVGKTGSNVNYFIEPMCVCAVAVGLLIGVCSQSVFGSPHRRDLALRLGLLCVSLGFLTPMVLAVMAKRQPSCAADHFDPGLTAIQENLVHEIAKQDRPVLSEDMVLLLRAGREVPIELAIFRELAKTGQWDQRRLLDLIDSHAFAFLITTPDKIYTPQHYTPEVLAAIERAYPHADARGPYVVRYPEGP